MEKSLTKKLFQLFNFISKNNNNKGLPDDFIQTLSEFICCFINEEDEDKNKTRVYKFVNDNKTDYYFGYFENKNNGEKNFCGLNLSDILFMRYYIKRMNNDTLSQNNIEDVTQYLLNNFENFKMCVFKHHERETSFHNYKYYNNENDDSQFRICENCNHKQVEKERVITQKYWDDV